MTTTTYHPLRGSDLHDIKYIYSETAVAFAFFGIQATLSIAAANALMARRGRSRWTLAVILSLLLFSLIELVGHLVYYLIQFPAGFGTSVEDISELLNRLVILNVVAERVNYVLSDAIVIWRVWVLWSDSLVAKGVLLVCMGGSLVGAIINTIWTVRPATAFQTAKSRALAITIPFLFTNAVAIILVGRRAWIYRRSVKQRLGLSTKTQIENILFLLLESGSIYCLVWVVYLVSEFTAGADTFNPVRIVGTVVHNISGIYPTIVILAVTHIGSTQSLLGTTHVSQDIRFIDSTSHPERTFGDSTTDAEISGQTHSNDACKSVESSSTRGLSAADRTELELCEIRRISSERDSLRSTELTTRDTLGEGL
ncbi:uncharacterized protein SCHCODRAFT_02605817 [Schizophyllum commune H4-8]|uniref:Expressed protein n=1 Tax=Schizophyllum commune (strain H4-8 / FGSC 9210) TaxID=578458 RepID=D8PSI3_SCHCM|nr:uncharacterized protein SCHCODRAFT_02605817 [Schizophyllum commune H4-8]KAI5899678.1 hypothetical protein SCHCODRAFT_02605817 [Schizophyllum commune H4-8]